MNELIAHISKILNKHILSTNFTYWLGVLGGKCFYLSAWITRKKQPASLVKVRKFCATARCDIKKAHSSVF
jgi:hypothetical protein